MLRDIVPAEHDLCRGLDDAERPARAAGPTPASSPLIAGIDVSSTNLTPPLPARRRHALARSDGGRPVRSARERRRAARHGDQRTRPSSRARSCRTLLTDGDGNPATGPEPTVVVVGNGPAAHASRRTSRSSAAGPPIAGATLEYVVRVTNIGTVPAYKVVIRDDLAVPHAGLSHVRRTGRTR